MKFGSGFREQRVWAGFPNQCSPQEELHLQVWIFPPLFAFFNGLDFYCSHLLLLVPIYSTGIVLVRTKAATTAVSDFIKRSTLIKTLPCRVFPLRFVGQGDVEDGCLTEAEQKQVLKSFRDGECQRSISIHLSLLCILRRISKVIHKNVMLCWEHTAPFQQTFAQTCFTFSR